MAATKKPQAKRRRVPAKAPKAGIPVFRTVALPERASTRRIEKTALKPLVRNRAQALLHVRVLVDALEEVDQFDPLRLGNRPPPALWLDRADYLRDVKSLLAELRQLGELLQDGQTKGTAAKKTIGLVASATTKFIDGYADALGKGVAALTIGAAGALLFHVGLGADVLAPLWDRLKIGK
jgi:hypothetical protein